MDQGRTLADLMRSAGHRQEYLQSAHTSVRKAEHLLGDDLAGIRHAAALIESEQGVRRRPGRPPVMTFGEIHRARLEREAGQSWEQVRRYLNGFRRKKGLPALSLSVAATWYFRRRTFLK